jgi:hypothetical protein
MFWTRKNRVLFLEDVPRFESKHLTRALFANKDITPLAFFQLPNRKVPGTKEWVAYGDRQGLTFDLTPEQLRLNKIIILGDFDSEAISPEHCRAILEFVEKGGSLILLGGQKLWGENGISKTELSKLLPFTRAGAPALEGKFSVAWTAEGRAHPALANNPDLPAELPPILSVFTGATLSGGAFTLVDAQTDKGRQPVLVSRVYGQGKVLAVLTDSLWRWVMQPGDDKPYPKFWRRSCSGCRRLKRPRQVSSRTLYRRRHDRRRRSRDPSGPARDPASETRKNWKGLVRNHHAL